MKRAVAAVLVVGAVAAAGTAYNTVRTFGASDPDAVTQFAAPERDPADELPDVHPADAPIDPRSPVLGKLAKIRHVYDPTRRRLARWWKVGYSVKEIGVEEMAALRRAAMHYDGIKGRRFHVALVESISSGEFQAGGLALDDWLMLSLRRRNGSWNTPRSLATTFHHEMAHGLDGRHRTDEERSRWMAELPSGFRYLGSGRIAILQGKASGRSTPAQARHGFVSEYARSALEEDFAESAERLFDPRWDLAAWTDKYARLYAKLELVQQFYERLDSQLTWEYFLRLRK